MTPRRAFTLLEMMAVVTLLGLLAGATAWSLAADARKSSRAKCVADIAHADRMARLAAQQGGQACRLQMDLTRQRICRLIGPAENAQPAHAMAAPKGCRIDRVVTASGAAGDELDAPTIAFSSGGRSDSYAVHVVFEEPLAGESAADGLGQSVWIVFAGLTGQATLVNDEDELNKLFAPERPDAS